MIPADSPIVFIVLFFTCFVFDVNRQVGCSWVQIDKDSHFSNRSPLESSSTHWQHNVSGIFSPYSSLVISEPSETLVFLYFPTSEETDSMIIEGVSLNDGSKMFQRTLKSENGMGGGLIPSLKPYDNFYVFYKEIEVEYVVGIYDNITYFDISDLKKGNWETTAIMYDKVDYLIFQNTVVSMNRPALNSDDGIMVSGMKSVSFSSIDVNWEIDEIRCDTNDCRMTLDEKNAVVYVMEDMHDPGSEITGFSAQSMRRVDAKTGDEKTINFQFDSDGFSKRVSVFIDSDGKSVCYFAQRLKKDKLFHLYAFNGQTDEIVWEKPVDFTGPMGTTFCLDVAISEDGKNLYFVCTNPSASSVDDLSERKSSKVGNSFVFGFKNNGDSLFNTTLEFDDCSMLAVTKKGELVVSCTYWIKESQFKSRIHMIDETGEVVKSISHEGILVFDPVVDSSGNVYYCIDKIDKTMSVMCYKRTLY